MNNHVVFYAYTPNAGHINSRLDGHYVPWHQSLLLALRQTGFLMHIKPEAMSGTVHEAMIEAITCKNAASRRIYISTTDARLYCGNGRGLRFPNGSIPLPDSLRRAPHKNRASYVTAIVAEYSTQVQYHQFIFAQSLSGGPRMWVRGALPKGHNGFKRWTRGSPQAHLIFDFRAEFHFANTGLEQLQGVFECLSGEYRSFANLRSFDGALLGTESLWKAVGRNPLHPASRRPPEGLMLRDGQLRSLKADARRPGAFDQLAGAGEERTFLQHDADTRSLLPRLRKEAAVSDQRRTAPRNQQRARFPSESRQIKPILRVVYEECTKVFAPHRGKQCPAPLREFGGHKKIRGDRSLLENTLNENSS
jgi:hypothetical protein